MKSIIIIQLCVLLLTIISTGVGGKELREVLNDIESLPKKKRINGVFEPSANGLLAFHSFSVTYKGILYPKRKNVAMKFTTIEKYGEIDYEMYAYLCAINDTKVEFFGIPTIYYYGQWKDCVIMAMTLFDPEFQNCVRDKNLTEMDLFILFRDFVRITKLIHRSGLFQQHASFMDIMFRKQQGFIYDFSSAVIIKNPEDQGRLLHAQRDWQWFFRAMYKFIQETHWEWLGFSRSNSDDVKRMENVRTFGQSLKDDADSDEWHTFTGLRKVFAEFAKYAYGDNNTSTIPFYDRSYEIIMKEIIEYAVEHEMLPIPSWLSDQDRQIAISATDEIPPITGILDPFALDQPSSSGSQV